MNELQPQGPRQDLPEGFPQRDRMSLMGRLLEERLDPSPDSSSDPGESCLPRDAEREPYASEKLIRLAQRIREEGNDDRARQLIKVVADAYEKGPDRHGQSLNEFQHHSSGIVRGLAKAASNYLERNGRSPHPGDADCYLLRDSQPSFSNSIRVSGLDRQLPELYSGAIEDDKDGLDVQLARSLPDRVYDGPGPERDYMAAVPRRVKSNLAPVASHGIDDAEDYYERVGETLGKGDAL